jgi:hypothetical protein
MSSRSNWMAAKFARKEETDTDWYKSTIGERRRNIS